MAKKPAVDVDPAPALAGGPGKDSGRESGKKIKREIVKTWLQGRKHDVEKLKFGSDAETVKSVREAHRVSDAEYSAAGGRL